MKNKLLTLLFLCATLSLRAEAALALGIRNPGSVLFPLMIASPNGKLNLNLAYTSVGDLVYSFSANSRMLIKRSKLGLTGLGEGLSAKVSRRSVNAVWKPIWGKRKTVPEIYNELTLDYKVYKLVLRTYDRRYRAFRYIFIREQAPEELTQFNFNGDYTAWYYNGERANIGSEKLSDCSDIHLPVMTIKVDDNNYMAIHEASLSYGEPLILKSAKKQTTFKIVSKPSDAWKVIMYGATPGQMVDSHLLELLNPPPSKEMAFSWVKPELPFGTGGLQAPRWRVFKYEMSPPSWKRMVDFASENSIRYLALDADWYGPEFGQDSDPLKGGKVAQVHEIIKYGKIRINEQGSQAHLL
ncbi:glycoside hydrolase family 97 N-terminal domain-containing protein [Pedobacter terrae]|uniref:glycoside hydrolase family 97 N-terminal domain-containing protein n=1 Tax=Pedobacter terrae TaxID=405671 RepID=UPI002FF69946